MGSESPLFEIGTLACGFMKAQRIQQTLALKLRAIIAYSLWLILKYRNEASFSNTKTPYSFFYKLIAHPFDILRNRPSTWNLKDLMGKVLSKGNRPISYWLDYTFYCDGVLGRTKEESFGGCPSPRQQWN